MSFLLFSLLIVFVVTSMTINATLPLAMRLGLLSEPNHRTVHDGSIPLVGGIAIYIGVLTSILLLLPLDTKTLMWGLTSFVILLLGVLDDANDLPAAFRLWVQGIATLILCYGTNLYLKDFGDIFFVGGIYIGLWGLFVTMLAVVGSINAFNMIDGIDGLAGSVSGVTLIGLAILFYINQDSYGYLFSIGFAVALLPYLVSNLGFRVFLGGGTKKIFMGDAGSMLIGFTIVWLLIYGSQSASPSFRPVAALWLMAIPLMDMAAIMIRRIRKGESPLKADKEHLHHIFLRAGFSQGQTLVIISVVSIIFASIGILGEQYLIHEGVMFLVFISIFAVYSYAIQHICRISKVFCDDGVS